MRVLMLATYFPKPGNPLMGTWALEQAQALAQHPEIDLTVVSFTSWIPRWLSHFSAGARAYAECPASYNWQGLEVLYPRWFWYPMRPIKNWEYKWPVPFLQVAWRTAAPFLATMVDTLQPDVVFAHHSAINGYIAAQIKREYGTPFVVSDHVFQELQACERHPSRREMFEMITSESSCMIAVSHRMEKILRQLFPHSRTRVVHNGTGDWIPQGKPPENSNSTRPTTVFSCGAFHEQKDFPLLIEAFGRIAHKHPGAVLRIAGDGRDRPLIEKAVRESGVADRVTLLGFVPHSEVLTEMAASDIFAMIGRNESFGVVFAEAMAARRPVICASDCGITDVIRSGVHGLTVTPCNVIAAAEALDTLLGNAVARERMGMAARELYETRLTWSHNAREMHSIFKEAVVAARQTRA